MQKIFIKYNFNKNFIKFYKKLYFMMRNIKTFLLCPIPEDQKPMADYLRLKENKFLQLIKKNNFLFFSIFLSISFFVNWFFCSFLLSVIFFFFYIQYINIIFALSSARLFYEEGSWYDGAFWEKPFYIIKNDRLLISQKINVFFKKLQKVFFFFFLFTFFYLFFLL
jgi:hypothetical protein